MAAGGRAWRAADRRPRLKPPTRQGDALETLKDLGGASRANATSAARGMVCAPQSCSNAVLTASSTCASGKCTAPAPTACAQGFACNAAGTACLTSCTPPGTNCAAATPYSVGSTCVAQKRADGQSCALNSDCTNGNCVNSVCCNTTCNGACDGSCSTGTCTSSSGKPC